MYQVITVESDAATVVTAIKDLSPVPGGEIPPIIAEIKHRHAFCLCQPYYQEG
jgi:hypothetical protein